MTGISSMIQLTRRPSWCEACIAISCHKWSFLFSGPPVTSPFPVPFRQLFLREAFFLSKSSKEENWEEAQSRSGCCMLRERQSMAVVRTIWQRSVFDPGVFLLFPPCQSLSPEELSPTVLSTLQGEYKVLSAQLLFATSSPVPKAVKETWHLHPFLEGGGKKEKKKKNILDDCKPWKTQQDPCQSPSKCTGIFQFQMPHTGLHLAKRDIWRHRVK